MCGAGSTKSAGGGGSWHIYLEHELGGHADRDAVFAVVSLRRDIIISFHFRADEIGRLVPRLNT